MLGDKCLGFDGVGGGERSMCGGTSAVLIAQAANVVAEAELGDGAVGGGGGRDVRLEFAEETTALGQAALPLSVDGGIAGGGCARRDGGLDRSDAKWCGGGGRGVGGARTRGGSGGGGTGNWTGCEGRGGGSGGGGAAERGHEREEVEEFGLHRGGDGGKGRQLG